MTGPVLAFDSSAAHIGAALILDGQLIAAAEEEMARGQAERLMPLLEDLLTQAGIAWRDLAGIGVGIGPGNFTGIRISVAAARGLALALNIPAVGIGRLEALAFGLSRPVLATLPAPRGQVYAQLFEEGGAAPPALLPPDTLPDGERAPPLVPAKLAEAMAHLAATRLGDNLPRPAPIYIRPADAAPPREAPPVLLP